MKKIFVLSFIVLIALCASASAISLAWFASSNYLRISSFDFVLETSDELKVSTNKDEDYEDEIHETMASGQYLIPVSSMNCETWMANKAHDPIFYAQGDRNYNQLVTEGGSKYVQPKDSVASSGYYSKEFYLKSPVSRLAYLDTSDLNTYLEADHASNSNRADKLISEGSTSSKQELVAKLNNLEKSLRVSILVDRDDNYYDYKIFDPFKEEDVLYGGVVDSDCKGMYDVTVDTVNSVNYEVLYGQVQKREKIVYSYNRDLNKKSGATWSDSGHYANTKTVDLNASIANGVEIAKEKASTFEENNQNIKKLLNSETADYDKMVLIPLDSNVPTRIVVSFYMEGWDKDNVDSTMGASFIAKLTFGLLDRYIAHK